MEIHQIKSYILRAWLLLLLITSPLIKVSVISSVTVSSAGLKLIIVMWSNILFAHSYNTAYGLG